MASHKSPSPSSQGMDTSIQRGDEVEQENQSLETYGINKIHTEDKDPQEDNR